MRLPVVIVLAWTLGAAACSDDPSPLIDVVVTEASPIDPPLERLSLSVTFIDGRNEETVRMVSTGALRDGDALRPWTVRVTPRSASHVGRTLYRFRASGLRGGAEVVVRQHRLVFLERAHLVLPMRLEPDCVGLSCDGDQTCLGGACQDDYVPSCQLVVGQRPASCDRDAASDAGSADVARDVSNDPRDSAQRMDASDGAGDDAAPGTEAAGESGGSDSGPTDDASFDARAGDASDGAAVLPDGDTDAGGDAAPSDAGIDAAPRDAGPPPSCVTNGECDDANACTDDVCNVGTCVHLPRICDDGDPCTIDSCDSLTGSCRTSPSLDATACGGGSCCGGSCTSLPTDSMHCGSCAMRCMPPTPSCLGGTCGACASAAQCPDDGLVCTAPPTCSAGTCQSELLVGRCLIDGVCRAADEANPANPCLACVPTTSQTAWTARTGAVCDDGRYCTLGDRCDASGVCLGPPRPCPAPLPCTTSTCNEVLDRCDTTVMAGFCAIGGACYPDGALDPSSMCERCDASASQTSWTPRPGGAPCDDTFFCTDPDTCSAGVCQGPRRDCSDADPCTSDMCDEPSRMCTHASTSAGCVIGGMCYPNHAFNPANPCQWCDSAVSAVTWTPVLNGLPCSPPAGGHCCEGACFDPMAACL